MISCCQPTECRFNTDSTLGCYRSSCPKYISGTRFRKSKRWLISHVVGQVDKNRRRGLPLIIYNKDCCMIGILKKRRVSSGNVYGRECCRKTCLNFGERK